MKSLGGHVAVVAGASGGIGAATVRAFLAKGASVVLAAPQDALLGAARLMHAVLPVMKAQRRGAIVNVGSVAGEAAVMGVYSGSKFGLRGLNDSVRREVRSFNIGVTLVEPGFVRTAMNPSMKGLPGPEVVADAIVGAALRPRRAIVVPRRYRLAVFLVKTFPALADAVFGNARIQERLNRDSRAERAHADPDRAP